MRKPKITQEMRYRESLIKYAIKHGVSKTARVYKTNRQYIYRWLNRYDGNIRSLANISTKPHYHPNQHTDNEIKLITFNSIHFNFNLILFTIIITIL